MDECHRHRLYQRAYSMKKAFLHRSSSIYYKTQRWIDLSFHHGLTNTGYAPTDIFQACIQKPDPNRFRTKLECKHQIQASLGQTFVQSKSPTCMIFHNTRHQAVENAVQIGQALTKKKGVLHLTDGHHEANHIRHTLETLGDDHGIALCMFQPLPNFLPPDKKEMGQIQDIVRLCNKKHILTLCDETITGMRRTGVWWGHQHYNLPSSKNQLPVDMMLFGNSVASGFPLAGLFVSTEKLRSCSPDLLKSQEVDTWTLQVASETLKYLAPQAWMHRGSHISSTIAKAIQEFMPGHIMTVHTCGVLITIQLRKTSYPSEDIKKILYYHGLIVGSPCPGSILLLPALNIEEEELQEVVQRLVVALEHLMDLS